MKKFRKTPRFEVKPKPEKKPIYIEFCDGNPLCWRFSSADRNGSWAWTNLSDPKEYKEVMEHLHEFENYNQETIKNTGSHSVSLSGLIKAARKRLEEIESDDINELFSLRVMGAKRVWCIQERNIMKILWWDPKHEVCPSKKKHT